MRRSIMAVVTFVIRSLRSVFSRSTLFSPFVDQRVTERVTESRERLQLAVSAARLGFFDWDMKSDSIHFSDQMKMDWGLTHPEQYRNLETALMHVHEDDRERVRRQVTTAIESGQKYLSEYRVVRPDGKTVWLSVSGEVVYDEEGLPDRFCGTSIDITAQKVLETERSQLYELPGHLLCVMDRCGRFRQVNAGFSMVLGYEPEELVGRLIWDFVHPDDIASTLESERQYTEGIIRRFENRFKNKQGSYRWLQWTGSSRDGLHYAAAVDITGFKVSHERLALAKKAARFGVFEWNIPEGHILWESELEELYGLGEGQFGGTLEAFRQRVHPDDLSQVDEQIAQSLQSGRLEVDWRIVRPNGEVRWVAARAVVEKNRLGEPQRMLGINMDVTEQKWAEGRLKESEERYRFLFESIDQGFCIIDLVYNEKQECVDYVFVETNPIFSRHARFENAVGRRIREFVPNLDPSWFEAYAKVAATRESVRFQLEVKSTGVSYDVFAFPVENSAKNRIAILFSDITERRKQEISLKESETHFKSLANSLPQLVWTADETGSVDYYNDRAQEYSGLSQDDLGVWRESPKFHPEDHAHTKQAWAMAVSNRLHYKCEHRIQMKNGNFRWHLSRAIPNPSGDGSVRWYGSATDIHEHKQAEQELIKAKEIADDANRAKSRFLANMSHEIRSPMNSVLGYADLLMERHISEEERVSYAKRIKMSGDHLLAIINDILDLSKVENGEIRLDPVSFSVMDLLSECVQSMSILAERKELQLTLESSGFIPQMIETDPVRLRQIVLNLLSNSIKFTQKGRIHLSVTYKRKRSRDESSGQLSLRIKDTGIGIDPEKQARLFQPFSQVDSTVTRKYGGTGLGLYLSRRLAHALNGKLVLESSFPGQGSTFALRVSVRESSKDLSPQLISFPNTVKPSVIADEHPLRILLVEDAPENQALMKIYLSKINAQIQVAGNGRQAIDFVKKETFDVILMDIMMPEVDGFEATREIRSIGFSNPIIALTAHALKEEIQKSMKAGCTCHLTKPVPKDLLINTIYSVLADSRPFDAKIESYHKG